MAGAALTYDGVSLLNGLPLCLEHLPTIPSPIGRRTAIGVLGSALDTALRASSGRTTGTPGPGATPPSAEAAVSQHPPGTTADSPENPTRAATKRIRTSFTPDYQMPPIQNGLAPVITRIQTKHPVVFLTIDDGITKTPETDALMTEFDLPAALFLTLNFVRDNPGFVKTFQTQGCVIENHTVSHNINMVRQMSYTQQLGEIAAMQDYAQQQFGRRPVLFRPPGGAYSTVMRKAVADAELRAIITWEAKANAGRMDYQVGNSLRPGDIILMHFRPEFAADLAAFRQAQAAAGLEVVLLEDFLGVK